MSTVRKIYLDNAATTPLDPRVLKAMLPFLKDEYGNPGSIHALGVKAEKAVVEARKTVARFFSALPDEIIFTSSGTESNNLAIQGLFRALEKSGKKINKLHAVTSVIEHSSVLEVFRSFEKRGLKVTYLPVNESGLVDLALLKKSIREETALVSIMYVNNEIGTIEPIREVAKIIRHVRKTSASSENGQPFFHIDASQAPLYLDCHVDRLGADLITIDGQKIFGPKGVGALFVRRGVALEPLFYGGGQEKGLRSGSENVPGIVGLAKAIEIAGAESAKETARLEKLKMTLERSLKQIFKNAVINGEGAPRVPGITNISFPDIDTEFLTLQLDAEGICVSTKSSCMRDSDESYVIHALTDAPNRARNSLRISLGRFTTLKDIQSLQSALKQRKKFTFKKS